MFIPGSSVWSIHQIKYNFQKKWREFLQALQVTECGYKNSTGCPGANIYVSIGSDRYKYAN